MDRKKFSLSFKELEGMRVLIVDDDPESISIIKKILSNTGLIFDSADCGEVALELAGKFEPDLILMDILMPGINGFEACKRLKSDSKTQNIPVIFISSRSKSEDCSEGFSIGGVDYISKPFYKEEILSRVYAQMTLRKLFKEKEHAILQMSDDLKSKSLELKSASRQLLETHEKMEGWAETANQRVLEKENFLKNLTENIVDGLITIDSEGIIQTFNPSAEKLFGYAKEEVIGTNVKILMPEPFNSEHDGYIKKFLETGVGKIIGIGREVTGLRKDGSTFPLDLGVSYMKVKDSYIFIGTLRDLTERNKANAELLRFSHVVNSTLHEIFVFDAESYKFITVNKAAQENLGYTMEELCEMTPLDLKKEYTEKTFRELTLPLIERKVPELVFVTNHQRKNGTRYPVEIRLQLLEQEVETVFFAIAQDITERKQFENQLIMARDAAEHASRAKSDFLARMSHELRTPLNAILGFAQLFKLEPKSLTSIQLENIDRISYSGKHLLDLINEILDLARIESEQINLTQEHVPVGEIIDEVITLLNPLAFQNEVKINYLKDELSESHVIADKVRLKQVIINLMSNAIKYNKKMGT